MAANKYQKHLVIYLEDVPYRELVNGAKMLPQLNEAVLTTKSPSRGWSKVFSELEDNLLLLNSNEKMHALLLMDFDNQYDARRQRFNEIIKSQACHGRVFMLGIDKKQSEDLKATLKQTNNEKIGQLLLEKCPSETSPEWKNEHLLCNIQEIERIKSAGMLSWIFKN